VAFLNSISVSIGIGSATGGPTKELLQAICENDLQVAEMESKIEFEKASRRNG
jgi:hypothetical protein